MIEILKILNNKGIYESIIPVDAPLKFRWNIQGVRTALMWLRLDQLDNKKGIKNTDLENAIEKYEQLKFSCLYGQIGGINTRDFFSEAEQNGIPHMAELRYLMQKGDINEVNGKIKVHQSRFWMLFSIFYLTSYFISFSPIVEAISLSPATFLNKFIGIGLYVGVLIGCYYSMHDCVFKPYVLIKKLGLQLESIVNRKSLQTRFYLVK